MASRRGACRPFAVEMGHHEEPQIAAHLSASVPNGTYLETFHPERDPLFYRARRQSTPFEERVLRVPQGRDSGLSSMGNDPKYRV